MSRTTFPNDFLFFCPLHHFQWSAALCKCDSEQDSFYRSCKEKDLKTNIQRLEEQNKELLLGLRDIELRNVKYAVVYNDILKLYGSKIVPNGNYVFFYISYTIFM